MTAHLSENSGYLYASPLLAGNLFSLAFGRNLDAHERDAAADGFSRFSVLGPPLLVDGGFAVVAAPLCAKGRLCYVETLYLAAGACGCALGLSVWAGLRDWRKLRAAAEKEREREGERGRERENVEE